MIKTIFDVPIYEWNITMLELESQEDIKELTEWCKLFQIDFSSKLVVNDTGFTYTDEISQKALVVIMTSSCNLQRASTVGHEKRHLEDFILKYSGVDDMEAAGYLAGYLSKFMIYEYNKH
jgi:hypothetical protein